MTGSQQTESPCEALKPNIPEHQVCTPTAYIQMATPDIITDITPETEATETPAAQIVNTQGKTLLLFNINIIT